MYISFNLDQASKFLNFQINFSKVQITHSNLVAQGYNQHSVEYASICVINSQFLNNFI
jgi:hypothetical protein